MLTLQVGASASAALNVLGFALGIRVDTGIFNGWQLAKMKKSIPDMSLSWNL